MENPNNIDLDLLWDILREECCATKPFQKATCVVMIRRDALKAVVKRYNREVKCPATPKLTNS